jgi:hypothetical protein
LYGLSLFFREGLKGEFGNFYFEFAGVPSTGG